MHWRNVRVCCKEFRYYYQLILHNVKTSVQKVSKKTPIFAKKMLEISEACLQWGVKGGTDEKRILSKIVY